MTAVLVRSAVVGYAWRSSLLLTVLLAATGTAVVQSGVADPLIDLFAAATEAIVRGLGGEIVREGNKLVSPSTGATVYVTQACDGLGVLAVFCGLLLAGGERGLDLAVRIGALVCALEGFNLLRVVALFHLRNAPTPVFDAAHVYLMPYLTIGIGTALIWPAARDAMSRMIDDRRSAPVARVASATFAAVGWRDAAATLAALIVGMVVWWVGAPMLLHPVLLAMVEPIAHWLSSANLDGIDSVADGQWNLRTSLIKPGAGAMLFDLPLDPRHFTLGLPFLWAMTVALAPRGRLGRMLAIATAPALLAMAIVLILQTYTMIPKFADSAHVASRMGLGLLGEPRPVGYRPPDPNWLAMIDTVRFTLVHINLFLLPIVLPAWAAAGPDRRTGSPTPQPGPPARRGNEARRGAIGPGRRRAS